MRPLFNFFSNSHFCADQIASGAETDWAAQGDTVDRALIHTHRADKAGERSSG